MRRLRARLPVRGSGSATAVPRRLADAEPLAGGGPPALDRAWSSASHEGVARDLVAALKFRRLLPVAATMAEGSSGWRRQACSAATIVPVPTARFRSLGRGFDPAAEIATALGERTGAPLSQCLARSGGGRQVGRRRAQRIGQPPMSGYGPRRPAACCSSTTS